METMERMPSTFDEQVLHHLGELAAKANLSWKDIIAYENALDRYYYNYITKEEIMKEAREEGLAEGRFETARNLKAMGLSYADIAKATSLSLDQINKL